MLSRRSLLLFPLALEAAFLERAWASDFMDSAGRTVRLPKSIKRIIPAGPPAEALLYSLAPDTLAGLIEPWTDSQKQAGIENSSRSANDPANHASETATSTSRRYGHFTPISSSITAISTNVTPPLRTKCNQRQAFPISCLMEVSPKSLRSSRRLGAVLQREERAIEIAKIRRTCSAKIGAGYIEGRWGACLRLLCARKRRIARSSLGIQSR